MNDRRGLLLGTDTRRGALLVIDARSGSLRARMLLDQWAGVRGRFIKVFPHEYRRALKQLGAAAAQTPQKLAA